MNITVEEWPVLSELLDRMLDVPTGERASWISRLSGVEAQMAPRLRSLLNANRNGSPWLDTLPPFVSAEGALGTEPDLVDHQPGDDIGPYRLIRLLGRGGMASVWYAQRNDLLVSRAVALKLPLSRGVQSNFRFAREREIVSRLEHPHIARLYDAGIDSNGHAYVALEYVDGIPITDFCEQRRLSLRERIELFAQVLGAVQYAHSRLVIHRDLKPSNILVTSAGQVCLLDFGVAKLLGADERDNVELTRAGVVLMTPAYASPEQVVGDPVTTASDIYSLGVILYELLLGIRPYRINRAGRGALEEAILRGDIPLPSAVPMPESTAAARSTTVRKFRRELRPDLDAILLRALHQRPEQRYVTASALADDLDSHRQGKPVQAHRPSRWYQSRKFIARHRLAVAGGGAFTLALVAAVVIALWQARNASQQASAAARERDLAIAAKQHREAVDEFLSDLLLEAGRTGKPISVGSLIDRAEQLSEPEFARSPEARAEVLKTVGDFEVNFKGINGALPYFEQAQQLLRNSHDDDLKASIACSKALLRGVGGSASSASTAASAAAKALSAIADDPHTSRETASECSDALAQVWIAQKDGPAAQRAAEQGLSQWRSSAQQSSARRLQLLTHLAEAQALNGQPDKAEAAYAAIMRELRALGRDRGIRGRIVRQYRVLNAIDGGDLGGALALLNEEMVILSQDVPDRPPPALQVYERSTALAGLGRYAEALSGFAETEKLGSQQDHALGRWAIFNAAIVLARTGRFGEAERCYGRAARDWEADRRSEGDEIMRLLARAELDQTQGRYGAARQSLSAALQLPVMGSRTRASLHLRRAMAELGESDTTAALADAHTALALYEHLRGDRPFSIWVGQSALTLGKVLQARQNMVDARQAYATAVQQLSLSVAEHHPDLESARSLLQQVSHSSGGAS